MNADVEAEDNGDPILQRQLDVQGASVRQFATHHAAHFARAQFDGVHGRVRPEQVEDEQVDGVRAEMPLVVRQDLSAVTESGFRNPNR
jgi:hypothetical protein